MDLNIYPPIIIRLSSFLQCFNLCYRWGACHSLEFYQQRKECSIILANSRFVERPSSMINYIADESREQIVQQILHSENSCSQKPCFHHEICSLIDAGRKHICISPEVYCGIPMVPDGDFQIFVNGLSQSEAVLICKEGHSNTGESNKIVCQKGGNWSTLDGRCRKVDCGRPPDIDNGFYRFNETILASSAYLSCNEGFEKNELVNNITCTKTGKWSDTLGSCILIDCGEPATQVNGKVLFKSTFYGSSAEIKCNTGYSWYGDISKIECTGEGNWSTSNGSCYKDCTRPVANKYFRVSQYNGFIAAFVSFGDESLSECNTDDIKWPTDQPCHIIYCQSPFAFSTNYSLRYLSTICVICNGQQFNSTILYSLECDENGTWQTKKSQCRNKCPSYYKWMTWVNRDSKWIW